MTRINGELSVTGTTTLNNLVVGGGTIFNGNVVVQSPVASTNPTTKIYVDELVFSGLSTKLNLTGGLLSGFLTLNSNPQTDFHAATKLYVDSAVSTATVGRHAIYIAAGSMRPSSVGGCGPLTADTTSANLPDILYLPFDPTTIEYAQFGMVLPASWDRGAITAKFHWTHDATTVNYGVVWGLQAVAIPANTSIGSAYGTAQTVTSTGGTTDYFYESAEIAAITVAGTISNSPFVNFRIQRTATDASDTLAVDARLIGVTLYITTAANTDA